MTYYDLKLIKLIAIFGTLCMELSKSDKFPDKSTNLVAYRDSYIFSAWMIADDT